MPAVNPKKLKRLLVAELLTPFAMKRQLTSGQLEDLVHRAMQDKRFDLSASSDDFVHYMNVEQATDWATEFERGGSAPHIFSNADQGDADDDDNPAEPNHGPGEVCSTCIPPTCTNMFGCASPQPPSARWRPSSA